MKEEGKRDENAGLWHTRLRLGSAEVGCACGGVRRERCGGLRWCQGGGCGDGGRGVT